MHMLATLGDLATIRQTTVDDLYHPIHLTVGAITLCLSAEKARELREALTAAITGADEYDLALTLAGSWPASTLDPLTDVTAHALDLIAGA